MKYGQGVKLRVALRPLGWNEELHATNVMTKVIKGRQHIVSLYEDAVFIGAYNENGQRAGVDLQEPEIQKAVEAIYEVIGDEE